MKAQWIDTMTDYCRTRGLTRRWVLPGTIITACLLSACASTVERRPVGEDQSTTVLEPPMKIAAASAQRLVLNMQLDPRHGDDKGWPDFKKEWIDIAKQQTAASKMAFVAQDGEPKPTGDAGTLVVVRVNDYRHVGVGARVLLGIMTGNAFIDAKVEFRDLASGQPFGERSYNTTSTAGTGIFAPMTPKQIYALVDEIIAEIKRQ